MTSRASVLLANVLVGLAAVAQASGPLSPLYLTQSGQILIVQGSSVASFPDAYGNTNQLPIAVSGDVRTAGWNQTYRVGGQYTLSGVPTGTSYLLPSVIGESYDGTTDGSYNYFVDYQFGIVYRTNRDYTNPVALFTPQYSGWAVTYDSTNNSLWVSDEAYGVVDDFSLSGTLLRSFNSGHMFSAALALDPADGTLWLVNDDGRSANYGYLEQYSKAGALLSVGPYVGQTWGGEFSTPEPSSFALLCSGVGLLFWRYRRPMR